MWHTEGVLSKVVPDEVSLEERAHLGVAWARVIEDQKVDFKRGHVDERG